MATLHLKYITAYMVENVGFVNELTTKSDIVRIPLTVD